MSRYAIDPGGVSSVLTSVDADLGRLKTADAAVLTAAEAALAAVGSSRARPGLERLLDDFRTVVPNLHEKITAAHVAATSATQAYVDADEDMAAKTPSAADTGSGR
jgi:hypothetical protein